MMLQTRGSSWCLLVAAAAALGSCAKDIQVSLEGRDVDWFAGAAESAWRSPQGESDLLSVEALSGSKWLPWTRSPNDDDLRALVVLLEIPSAAESCEVARGCEAFVELKTIVSSMAFDGISGSLRVWRSAQGAITVSGVLRCRAIRENRLWPVETIRVVLEDISVVSTGDVLGKLADDSKTSASRVLTRWRENYGSVGGRDRARSAMKEPAGR